MSINPAETPREGRKPTSSGTPKRRVRTRPGGEIHRPGYKIGDAFASTVRQSLAPRLDGLKERVEGQLKLHRRKLKQIEPTLDELQRLGKTINRHLTSCGYSRVPKQLKKQLIEKIFETQDWKPFFWITSDLPFCWNAPKYFCKTYMKYEWGHLNPLSMNAKQAQRLDNLCLMSSRCNNQLQSGIPMKELLKPFDGSLVGKRIKIVLQKRKSLTRKSCRPCELSDD